MRKGFTTIEFFLVMGIVAILFAIVIAALKPPHQECLKEVNELCCIRMHEEIVGNRIENVCDHFAPLRRK